MTKDKFRSLEVLFGAALELLLQRALVHVVDKIVWPVADLDVELLVAMTVGPGLNSWYSSCGSESEEDRRGNERAHREQVNN